MIYMNFKTSHGIHGLGLGVVLYLISKNLPVSVVLGLGAYAYMAKYGHSLPQ